MKYDINNIVFKNGNFVKIIDREEISGHNVYYLDDKTSVEESQISNPPIEYIVDLATNKIRMSIKGHPGLKNLKITLDKWETDRKQKEKENDFFYKLKKYVLSFF